MYATHTIQNAHHPGETMPTPRPAPNRIRTFGVAACLAVVAVACGEPHHDLGMKTTFTVS